MTLGIDYNLHRDGYAVEYPDERCELPDDRMFQSATELLEYWQLLQKHDPRQLFLPFADSDEPKNERS